MAWHKLTRLSKQHMLAVAVALTVVNFMCLYQGRTAYPLRRVQQERLWFLQHSPVLHTCHGIPAKGRISSAPYITGDTFRGMADHVFDELIESNGSTWRPKDVKAGDIIFVKTDFLHLFFTTRHRHINASYILITHNSDFSAPSDVRNGNYSSYLPDAQLVIGSRQT